MKPEATSVWKELPIFVLQLVAAASALGIAVDLVTANVAVEYFTIHHPHVVDSESPWVMALVWGIGASWWVGLLAAPLLWWANTRRAEPLTRKRVMRAAGKAMGFIWLVMMGIVLGVYLVAGLIPEEQRKPTFDFDRRIMAVAMAHAAEYVLAGMMTLVLMVRISRIRE